MNYAIEDPPKSGKWWWMNPPDAKSGEAWKAIGVTSKLRRGSEVVGTLPSKNEVRVARVDGGFQLSFKSLQPTVATTTTIQITNAAADMLLNILAGTCPDESYSPLIPLPPTETADEFEEWLQRSYPNATEQEKAVAAATYLQFHAPKKGERK